MRPLVLEIENFTSFRGKQAPLDMTGFDLFAIAGPTGSGKSSLLDALVFALYGKIPRVGKGCIDMMSQGRDRMMARLDFRTGERTYRVTRVLRRGRATEAQIEDISTGDPLPIADRVRDVDAAVLGVVGLGFEAFTQCVILPQGEFQRFLKSDPGKRRDIMTELLRLTVYEKMRLTASQAATQLGASASATRTLLDTQFREVTVEAIERLRVTLNTIQEENRRSDKALVVGEKELAVLRDRNRTTKEVRTARDTLSKLTGQESRVAADEARVGVATRATGIVPRLDAADQAAAVAKESLSRSEKAAAALQTTGRRRAEAAARVREAEDAAKERPALEKRIQELDQAIALLPQLAEARLRLKSEQSRDRAAQTALTEAQDAAARASTALEGLSAASDAAQRDLEGVDYDPDRHRRLDALRDAVSVLRGLRETEERLAENVLSVERAVDGALRESKAAAGAARAAQKSLRDAENDLAAARAELDRARRDDMVAHLRDGLDVGAPCPVCEQTVDALPTVAKSPALDRIEARIGKLEERERLARQAAADAGQKEAKADATSASVRKDLAETQAELAQARKKLGAQVDALAAEVAGDRELAQAKRPDASLPAILDRLIVARLAHETAITARDAAARRAEAAQSAARLAAERVGLLEDAASLAAQSASEASVSVKTLEASFGAFGAAEPRAERDLTVRKRDALQSAVDAARHAEANTSAELAAATSAADQTVRVARETAAASTNAAGDASAALQQGGFRTPSEARAAYLDQGQLDRLQAQIQTYRSERHAWQRRVADLEVSLGGQEVEDATVESAESELDGRRGRHEEGLQEEATLKQRLADAQERAKEAQRLTKKLRDIEGQHALQKQLADDLGGPAFQQYLLEETFRELIDGASARLFDLTGRYGLGFDDSAFVVIDHDNASERRNAETLSGGETFLASLSLALELSEQVRRSAGALNLDSLFIDEGFGTLDPETLDTVATAIEGLQVGGRMVGIITHIPELTARFPVQIHVSKGAESARIQIQQA